MNCQSLHEGSPEQAAPNARSQASLNGGTSSQTSSREEVPLARPSICLFANTLTYPHGGGHFWVYLNWALGATALGYRVIWMEGADLQSVGSLARLASCIDTMKQRLEPYGLASDLALWSWTGAPLPASMAAGCLDLEEAIGADLLLNFEYSAPSELIKRFRRSALVDIDPGLLQMWVAAGHTPLARHDIYFTIGETVGQPGARFPDTGRLWQFTPPCVAVDWWPVHDAPAGAPFTAVSHWDSDRDYMEDDEGIYANSKKAGFLPFRDLPRLTDLPLELALCLAESESADRQDLCARGWRMRDAHVVAAMPWDYQAYIQNSLGEFGWVKPSCVRLQNAWISDRTLCFLASGKPAVVQHTGRSRYLPDAAGLFRFHDLAGAVRAASKPWPPTILATHGLPARWRKINSMHVS